MNVCLKKLTPGLLLPVGQEDTLGLEESGQMMIHGLDVDEPELGILVPEAVLQVLADAHSLLDQE